MNSIQTKNKLQQISPSKENKQISLEFKYRKKNKFLKKDRF